LGEFHAQAFARDLIDTVALGPGGLLQLQPAELDVEVVAGLLQPGQLLEQLAVHVAHVHHTNPRGDRAGQQDDEQQAAHAVTASFSATRNTALRARGLTASSASSARMAPPMANS